MGDQFHSRATIDNDRCNPTDPQVVGERRLAPSDVKWQFDHACRLQPTDGIEFVRNRHRPSCGSESVRSSCFHTAYSTAIADHRAIQILRLRCRRGSLYWWRRIIQLRMFSSSGLSIRSFEPGVVVPIDGLVNRVFSNDPGAAADKFAEQGCGHIGDKLLEGAESSEPGVIHSPRVGRSEHFDASFTAPPGSHQMADPIIYCRLRGGCPGPRPSARLS